MTTTTARHRAPQRLPRHREPLIVDDMPEMGDRVMVIRDGEIIAIGRVVARLPRTRPAQAALHTTGLKLWPVSALIPAPRRLAGNPT